MGTFVNKYQLGDNSLFFRFIEITGSTDLLIVGRTDNKGYVGRISAKGNLLWENTYNMDTRTCMLLHGCEVDTQDFLILGHIEMGGGSNRRNYWLLRIKPDGTVVWNKEIYHNKSRIVSRIVPFSKQRFLIAGWNNTQGIKDSVEAIVVNHKGAPVRSALLQYGRDDQLMDVISSGKNILFSGISSFNGQYHGFLFSSTSNLVPFMGHRIQYAPHASFESIDAMCSLDSGDIAIAGNLKGSFYIAIGRYSAYGNNAQFDPPIRANITWDCGIRKMISFGGFLYVLGWNKKNIQQQFVVKFQIGSATSNPHDAKVWVKTFAIGEDYYLTDMIKNIQGVYLCGQIRKNNKSQPLLIKTDDEFSCCLTETISTKASYSSGNINLILAKVSTYPITISNKPKPVLSVSVSSQKEKRCPSTSLPPPSDYVIQSPAIHLQAAGSLGVESSQGIHTRWLFRGDLGKKHLPKGDYATLLHTYNKPDDYVKLYRAPYDPSSQHFLDLSFSLPPAVINEPDRLWVYSLSGNVSKTFYLRFLGKNKYFQSRQSIDPAVAPDTFIKNYASLGGLFEIELKEGLCFGITVKASMTSNQFKLQIESISKEGNISLADTFLSNRLEFTGKQQAGVQQEFRIVGENMKKIQFVCQYGFVLDLRFEFYGGFFHKAVDEETWESIGSFALTKDDAEAFTRLEDTSRFLVQNDWEKFNDGAKVDIPSYQKRWTGGTNPNSNFPPPNDYVNGLKYGVEQYLDLSEDSANLSAKATIEEVQHDLSNPGNEVYDSMQVEYLNLLHIASLDYHVARMLGLAYIDTYPGSDQESYIYLIEYHAAKNTEISPPELKQHFYMSLPTARKDERYPQEVETLPVSYGLSVNGSNPAYSVTDAQGYVPFEQVRFINVHNKLAIDYSESNGFFTPGNLFSLEQFTSPVFTGIEYKKQGESHWRNPEIAHQEIFGHTETLPLSFYEEGSRPAIIHQEREEGFHKYASYPINIFSRAGQLSNDVLTDETKFTIPNTLLPPHNLRAQLIQPEDPLMLTSQAEQDLLSGISDQVLVRVIFDYSHIHDINFQFGETVEFVFRETPQRIVKGAAISTTPLNPSNINTGPYTYASTGEIEQPEIPAAVQNNFVGGTFTLNEEQFEIVQIIQSGPDPRFTVEAKEVRDLITDGNGNTSVVQSKVYPSNSPDELFMIQENLGKIISWDHILAFQVQIGDSWATRSESFENEDGKTIQRELRGIWGDAIVKMVGDLVQGTGGTGPGSSPPRYDIIPGQYEIEFSNFQLNHHPQYVANGNGYTGVDWHGGYVRVPIKNQPNKEWKALKVSELENIGNGQILKLLAFDESYDSSNEIDAFDPNTWGANPSPIEVNFYPGYKVHLLSDPANNFIKESIFPLAPKYIKNTLFSARSSAPNPNSGGGSDYTSDVGTHQIINAERIIAPLPPEIPLGPEYATTPDLYQKATYTFEMGLKHDPYALVFYRININALLHALYEPLTIQNIKASLLAPEEDPFFTSRWKNLVRFDFTYSNPDPSFPFYDNTGSNADGTFRKFPAQAGYQFPRPNKPPIFDDSQDPGSIIPQIKEAIYRAATPILEKPLLYSSIKANTRITQVQPAIVVSGNPNTIQFTDFLIDGEKLDSYFYFGREMGSRQNLGIAGPIAGPIQLINNRPPDVPLVRKVTTQLADVELGTVPAINLELLGFSPSDKIRKVALYRANDELDSLTIRTMKKVKELTLNASQSIADSFEIQDDFSSSFDSEIPYGDELFYRVVSFREVNYKKDTLGALITEYIPSIPTKAFKSGVVDIFNPAPPSITIANNSDTIVDGKIRALELEWNKTCYNGTYYLFKMNSVGNWNKVFEITSNDATQLNYTLPNSLAKEDEDGNTIYLRFKITVEGASGLLNLEENIITI